MCCALLSTMSEGVSARSVTAVGIEEVRLSGWPANVRILTTTRRGGVSVPPFDSFNLAQHVGDDPEAVIENRCALRDQIPSAVEIAWLTQVHGTAVVEASGDFGSPPEADGCWTRETNLASPIVKHVNCFDYTA